MYYQLMNIIFFHKQIGDMIKILIDGMIVKFVEEAGQTQHLS